MSGPSIHIKTIRHVSQFYIFSQELDLRLFCVKGIGRDHAKFSPVGKSVVMYSTIFYVLTIPGKYFIVMYDFCMMGLRLDVFRNATNLLRKGLC